MLHDPAVLALSPEAFKALMELVKYVAAGQVWTYSAPSDGSLHSDDKRLSLMLAVDLDDWLRVKASVLAFFEMRDGRLFLKPDWILIVGGSERPVISAAIRMAVMRRDNWTCGYCGTTEAPFDLDHIIPVSRGGSNSDKENLICACAKCNRSKGADTPAEWLNRAPKGGL
jgi:hypothetical protein